MDFLLAGTLSSFTDDRSHAQAECLSCLFNLRFRDVVEVGQRSNDALPSRRELPRSFRNLVQFAFPGQSSLLPLNELRKNCPY
jgi:hypothetical protein